MPFSGEYASKSSHIDIIKNPDVAKFLEHCEHIELPTKEQGEAFAENFKLINVNDNISLPEHIFAFDGSFYEANIYDYLPHTKVGYVKVSSLLINLQQFQDLRPELSKFVNPFKVAELQDNNDSINFALPSSNIKWNGKDSVVDSFREVIDECLNSPATHFNPSNPNTSLRKTLFCLASLRPGEMGTSNTSELKLHKCPKCTQENITVKDQVEPQFCPACSAQIYPADCLRLYEEVCEYQSNVSVITRFMNIVEHLLPIHYIRYLYENSMSSLASTAFFKDGPLAIFGTAAWLHKPIMKYLHKVNSQLLKEFGKQVTIIGLSKTGQVVDHFKLIEKYITKGSLYCLKDDFRYKYVIASREPSNNGFGSETYYGQDFLYKTQSGRCFVFSLPYPFEDKSNSTSEPFSELKTRYDNYKELDIALALINHFESDLYENALIPVALAHKYTAISISPGGRVLDLLTQQALNKH